jgi:regulation of enolase protein 1 (concanavalin A-like superfamily)
MNTMTKWLPVRAASIAGFLACAALLAAAQTARAQSDQMYFPAVDNVTNVLVARINAETVRVDMSAWYLTEHSVSIAVANAFNRGVRIRLIGDRGSIFEIDAKTKGEFYWLASQGVPIRLRYNPSWFPEIDHWKATIFKGQRLVAFGSANYTPNQLAPFSATDYSDETVLFTTDASLVNAFLTKFDQIWNDTTTELDSIISGPPYFKNWNDACALESACSDYRTRYPNPAPMSIDTARLEPDNPMPADLIWAQGPELNNRIVQEINAESSSVRFVIYRLTVDNITNALLAKFQSGVPMQLIVEPSEYLNRKWPEFWLTHANIDKLWAAGVPIRQRQHNGLTHMKMLVTSRYATNASSNFAANWQRDNNYFVSASAKPTAYQAMAGRFDTMWNDTAGFTAFVPQPPDAAVLATPVSGATSVSQTPTLTWNRAAFATSYDVYLGTSASSLSFVGNVAAQLVNNPPSTYSWTAGAALAGATTYYWRVVARTNANLVASSSTWSFVTGGTGGGGGGGTTLPSPWVDVDLGSVGAAGSASYSNGTFTVNGSGADIWGSTDSFNYVYRSLSGDGTIVARVASLGNTNTYAKAGVMIREQLTSNSAHVVLDVRPGGAIEFMTRGAAGGATTYLGGATQSPPAWLRLARSGNTVTASVSADGATWSPAGSTTVSMGTSVYVGLAVCSHVAGTLMAAAFDNVSVTTGGAPPPPPPPPPPSASNVVIYAGDVPLANVHGSWARQGDGSAAGGFKLVTPDVGYAEVNNPLASPAHYVDVTFNAEAGVAYRIWLRLQALNNSKYNDAVWVQFSDARVNGSPAYPIGTTSGLLVNLATTGTATSLSSWGWQNTAYWLSQATTVTFPTTGSHTLRIQVREDGVQFDQIVLSPSTYLSSAPGAVSNDSTIVAKQ